MRRGARPRTVSVYATWLDGDDDEHEVRGTWLRGWPGDRMQPADPGEWDEIEIHDGGEWRDATPDELDEILDALDEALVDLDENA